MGFLLSELRTSVRQLPHLHDTTFTDAEVDRAARWAIQKWLRETRCSRAVGSVTISSAGTTVDIGTTLTDFLPGCALKFYILGTTNKPLKSVSLDKIMRLRRNGTRSDTPYFISIQTATSAQIFPTADAAYTMLVYYWKPLQALTPGTASAFTIDIDTKYLDDIANGACYRLLADYPGHNASKLGEDFMESLARAIGVDNTDEVWEPADNSDLEWQNDA